MAMDRLVKGRSLKPKVPLRALGHLAAMEPMKVSTTAGLLPTGTTKTLQGGVTIKANLWWPAAGSCNELQLAEVLRAAPEGAQLATKGCEVKLMYEARSLLREGKAHSCLREHCRDACRTRTADGLTSERLISFSEMPWPQWSQTHPTLRRWTMG